MGMKKGEMEEHRNAYSTLMGQARSAQQQGLYRDAVEFALSSFDHIDGMMQYERKYEDREFKSIEAIDMILRYAPLLLDFPSLDKFEALLKGCPRIEKNTSTNLGEALVQSRALMWDAHCLWNHIDRHPDSRQDDLRRVLGGDQDQWRSIAEAWEKIGLIRRTPESGSYTLALCTRLGEVVSGKCPSCGSIVEAPKAMLLEESTCPDCRAKVLFVILPTTAAARTKE